MHEIKTTAGLAKPEAYRALHAQLGVLDLDSPNLARFDADDAVGLQAAVKLLLDGSDLSRLAD
jgi:hypothetical protein